MGAYPETTTGVSVVQGLVFHIGPAVTCPEGAAFRHQDEGLVFLAVQRNDRFPFVVVDLEGAGGLAPAGDVHLADSVFGPDVHRRVCVFDPAPAGLRDLPGLRHCRRPRQQRQAQNEDSFFHSTKNFHFKYTTFFFPCHLPVQSGAGQQAGCP